MYVNVYVCVCISVLNNVYMCVYIIYMRVTMKWNWGLGQRLSWVISSSYFRISNQEKLCVEAHKGLG